MSALKQFWEWLLSNGGILVGGISGLFSAFSENRKARMWKVLPIVGIVIGMIWAFASANYADQQERQRMKDAIDRVDAYVQGQSAVTVSQVDTNTRTALNELLEKLGVRKTVAQNASPQQALEIVNAGLLVHPPPKYRRDALTIWVFPHVEQDVDLNVVMARLKQLAGKVEIHKPLHPETEANSIWWSDGSNLDEAKSVALTAASAGVQIKQICPSTSVAVRNLIQLGGSVGAQRLPTMTPAEIEALSRKVCQGGSNPT
jgi:hypothetical protein